MSKQPPKPKAAPLEANNVIQANKLSPPETKEQLFHRLMDRHFTILKARYKMMRRTVSGRRVSAADADLIRIAVESECQQFVTMLKTRVEEENNGPSSIWQ